MLRGEAHRLLAPDEADVEEDQYSPLITPFSLQRHNRPANDYAQFENGKPPLWPRTRPSRHIRALLVRLLGPVRTLLCPTIARTAFIMGLLMFMLCFAFCTLKPSPSTPEAPKIGSAQELPVENPIFKVLSMFFRARKNTDAFLDS